MNSRDRTFRKCHFSLSILHNVSGSEPQRILHTEVLWSLGIIHDYLFILNKHQKVPASQCCPGNCYTHNLVQFIIKANQIRLKSYTNRPTVFTLPAVNCFVDTADPSNTIDMLMWNDMVRKLK